MAIQSHGGGNIDFWRVLPGDSVRTTPAHNRGWAGIGSIEFVQEFSGHYPWVAVHHPDEAAMLVQGFSQVQPGVICPDNGQNNWPAEGPFDAQLFRDGWKVFMDGGDPTQKGQVPSFTCFSSIQGFSELLSFDQIAELDFDAADAFVRGGMLGTVPRTMSNYSMRALMYRIYRDSQRFMREGAPLMQAVLARWPA